MGAACVCIIILIIIFLVGVFTYFVFFHNKNQITVIKKKKNKKGKKVHFNETVRCRKYPSRKMIVCDSDPHEEEPPVAPLSSSTPEYASWDDNFKGSLVTDEDRNEFSKMLMKEHQDYNRAHSKFTSYLMDNDVIATPEFDLNAFKNDKFRGKNIGDVYDLMVTPQIVSQAKHESKLNDTLGYAPYTGVKYRPADFGNDF